MTTPPPSANTLDLRPLMFETFVCTLAVMSFVALVGPLARKLGLAPWQAGAAVTVGGIAWMLAARPWGIASDRHGRRRILLGGLAGFALSYGSLCLFIVLALHWTCRPCSPSPVSFSCAASPAVSTPRCRPARRHWWPITSRRNDAPRRWPDSARPAR